MHIHEETDEYEKANNTGSGKCDIVFELTRRFHKHAILHIVVFCCILYAVEP